MSIGLQINRSSATYQKSVAWLDHKN
jgi:hypothetical protein